MILARKGLLKTLGSPSLGDQGQRPIFKPSQQRPQYALCHPLNVPRSSPQPSPSIDLKRAGENGIYRQEDSRKQHSSFSGRRDDSFQHWQLPADGILAEIVSRFCSTGKGNRQPGKRSILCPSFHKQPFTEPLLRAGTCLCLFDLVCGTTLVLPPSFSSGGNRSRQAGQWHPRARLGPFLPQPTPFSKAVPCDRREQGSWPLLRVMKAIWASVPPKIPTLHAHNLAFNFRGFLGAHNL